MGRTLHYELKGSYIPTQAEENKLISLSKSYNKMFNWTCENVWLSTLDYFPNWGHFAKGMSTDCIWEQVNQTYDKYIKKGLSDAESINRLNEKGLIAFHHRAHLRGFTKVGGNELNAHTVIMFILEGSKILPTKVFSLRDEGAALYCPILIKDGLAKPDIASMTDSLEYWKGREYLHNGGHWDVGNTEAYYRDLINIDSDWGESDQYIRPLCDKAGLNSRKPFKTTVLEKGDIAELKDIAVDFLRREREESSLYYEDIRKYPSLNIKQNH